jgi:hypothetical protein
MTNIELRITSSDVRHYIRNRKSHKTHTDSYTAGLAAIDPDAWKRRGSWLFRFETPVVLRCSRMLDPVELVSVKITVGPP